MEVTVPRKVSILEVGLSNLRFRLGNRRYFYFQN
jgi:hypothetical protein